MFEDQTFEVIEKRILADVDDSFHKDEGSFIYTATAPTSAEHQQIYIDLDRVLDEMFPDTASREYLLHHAKLRGLEPKEATQAIWIGKAAPTDVTVPIGSRFNAGDLNLQVIRKLSTDEGTYLLKVETAGTAGNTINDKLVAISYIKGLYSMTLTSLSESGTDDESTDEFRERVLTFMQKPATSGNKNSYYNWAESVDGIGDVKVFSPPDTIDGVAVPDGNVYIVAINENKEPAGSNLLASLSTYIESVRPIGATVNCVAADKLEVNVAATATLSSSAVLDTVTAKYKAAVEAYLEENALALKRVSVAKLGDLLLDIDGVEDYTTLTVNGSATSITVGDKAIAMVGTVEVTSE